jgi:FMN phosphatase YigB (HAD superfamily)
VHRKIENGDLRYDARGAVLKKAAVIMDWYGVISDREETSKSYRRVFASLLRSRYGGSLGKWLKAHDLAFEWYVTEWQRLYKEHRNGSKFERDLEARAIRRVFKEAGLYLDSKEASRLATQLEYEIASQIASVYPEVASSLKELKDMHIDLYIASDVSSDHLKGLLESSGLGETVSNGLTPDSIGAGKADETYWPKVFDKTGLSPDQCLVVDDTGSCLKGAKKSGASTVYVQRKKLAKPKKRDFKPDYTIETLKELPSIVKEKIESID